MDWQSPDDSVIVYTENMTYVPIVTVHAMSHGGSFLHLSVLKCAPLAREHLLLPANCRYLDLAFRERALLILPETGKNTGCPACPTRIQMKSLDLSTQWGPELLESARWFAFLTWTPGTYGTCPQTVLLLSRYWTYSLPRMLTYHDIPIWDVWMEHVWTQVRPVSRYAIIFRRIFQALGCLHVRHDISPTIGSPSFTICGAWAGKTGMTTTDTNIAGAWTVWSATCAYFTRQIKCRACSVPSLDYACRFNSIYVAAVKV